MGVIVREKVLGSGVYWMWVYKNGRRTAKKVGKKADAEKLAKELRKELALGHFLPVKKEVPTLEEFYQRFKRVYMETALRKSTRTSYETSFRLHILPELGKYHLDEITAIGWKNSLQTWSRRRWRLRSRRTLRRRRARLPQKYVSRRTQSV